MDVDEKKPGGKTEYRGQTYYFCSSGCKQSFDKDPQRYTSMAGMAGAHGGHH